MDNVLFPWLRGRSPPFLSGVDSSRNQKEDLDSQIPARLHPTPLTPSAQSPMNVMVPCVVNMCLRSERHMGRAAPSPSVTASQSGVRQLRRTAAEDRGCAPQHHCDIPRFGGFQGKRSGIAPPKKKTPKMVHSQPQPVGHRPPSPESFTRNSMFLAAIDLKFL